MIITTNPMGWQWLMVLVLVTALFNPAWAGGGHDSHDDHDEHSEEPALVYTHYSNNAELFVEFPPLVVNQPSTFVAHFTRLKDFKPMTSGVLDIHLRRDGKTAARFRVKAPARTGIFLPVVTAKHAGTYQLILEVRDGDFHSTHDLGEVTVFASKDEATVNQETVEGEIGYLKEQQWVNPFAIVKAEMRALRPSVPGFATVSAPSDGYAVVRAPSDGYFSAETLVNAGQIVTASQSLGSLIPRLGEGADIGHLLVAQERAKSQLQLVQADVKRLKALYEQGAIPQKRLLEARQVLEVAKVELQTAQSRIQQRAGQKGTAAAGIALRAPIAGEVVSATARPGAFVRAGEALFTLAVTDRRWLEVAVPERFGDRIRHTSGAWINHDGRTRILDASHGAEVVRISQQVEPTNRTVSVAIEYPLQTGAKDSGPSLLGARLSAHVYVDKPKALLAIPVSAIIDDGGQPTVYVQTEGESFARRTVTLGLRDGNLVEVVAGVAPGEWVVSKGAYYIKLASTGGDAIGHGHAH
ncbi:efflux RND transporter periplasmic adaptor subunit [Gilvimarinus sp. SDUM040013]|uniref:Efflux RND transporter periplasmic adaptor subunit n=1 Tax=Gilvimarinus gilvus TaxID=3058038 RepID=A0ABU4S240_9GAMM|nr:efflux RND transporter periplasmic adaptor subunit [Gilvimarinus sp. SDUM040013]MDO3385311.1 efflux RND transporter periplasmic adaptor subunit [Gilvimarinus sp. SDUM040013]MDX6849294.1 efflux RND transporter periplasmic adaptor subunit [Gilvimarinus sp. SDUM040013]